MITQNLFFERLSDKKKTLNAKVDVFLWYHFVMSFWYALVLNFFGAD